MPPLPTAPSPPPRAAAPRRARADIETEASPRQSPTRERIFAYVRARLLEGNPPSVREIRDALGLRAVQSVQVHLQTLTAEGRLQQTPGKVRGRARGYQLCEPAASIRLVPLLGRVQAGAPTLALEEDIEHIPTRVTAQEDELFALRVRGESMVDAGILPGDIVIVRRGVEVRDGEVVVALLGDEATVKHFHRDGAFVELRPANLDFASLHLRADDVVILGKVVELQRSFGRVGR